MAVTTLEFPAHMDLAEFVSQQAHDLRAPFNQLVGFTKIVLNGQDGPLTDLQREDLDAVYRSGMRALALVSNLIDMARLCRAEKSVRPAEVDAQQLLEQAAVQWKKSNPAKELHFEYRVGISSPSLRVDEAHIRQILGSLASYAAEYVESPARIVLAVDDETGGLLFTVAGVGERTRLQSAFDLQMLGYISRALIELQHGTIRAAEANEHGTVVSFFLPRGRD